MPAEATDVYSDRDSAPDMPSESEAEDNESKNDEGDESDEKGDGKDSESATGLLSKSFFGDKKLEVGSVCKVKITRLLDDQIQVEYVPHGKSESEDDDDEPPEESVYD